MKRRLMYWWAVVWWGGMALAEGTTLDSNFRESVFTSAGSGPTGMAWAPDGSNRLFVSRKGGAVAVVKDGVTLPTPFATISPLYTGSECGLIGICFDPNFMVNGYVYLFATVSGAEQQILRYTAVGDVGGDKTVLVQGLPTQGANHDGGAVGIGPDGKLYWAVGDQGNGTGVDGDLTSLAAKVGRANRDGSLPADNPFADGPGGNNDYIWARGFRNPFSFTFQPDSGALWVNCVGTSYEQIFAVDRKDHAGWNDYENYQPAGYLIPKIKYRTNGADTRNLTAATGAVRLEGTVTFTTTAVHGFRQGEKITIAGVADPSFNGSVFVASVPAPTTFTAQQAGVDATSGSGTATTLDQGGCVTGGCFYDSTAVPPEYRGNFFFGDYNSGRLMRAKLGPMSEVLSVDYFALNLGSPIDTSVGPDGALYSVNYAGTVYRLDYTNILSQHIVVTPTFLRMDEGGSAALTVRLGAAPAGNVEVSLAFAEGDNGITVTEGGTLVFGPESWSVPQVVKVRAAADADSADGRAEFTLSAPGLETQRIIVHALDLVSEPFLVGPVRRDPGPGLQPVRVGLSGLPGNTYVLEARTDETSAWMPLSTNTLTDATTNVVDPESIHLPQRIYRSRLWP